MRYITEAFDVTTFDQAKHVVLSSDPNNPKKFEQETNFFVDVLNDQIFVNENTLVFDFGCGVGRISKELINRFNCKVIGLDISPSMLLFAKLYTANTMKFEGTHSYNVPNSIDLALSVFSLQHAEDPKKEIDNIVSILKPNGIFVLLNENNRLLPLELDDQNYVIWKDDGFDVFGYTETLLKKVCKVPYINSSLDIVFYQKQNDT